MKKILLVVLMLALGIGGVLWWKKSRGEAVPKPEEKPRRGRIAGQAGRAGTGGRAHERRDPGNHWSTGRQAEARYGRSGNYRIWSRSRSGAVGRVAVGTGFGARGDCDIEQRIGASQNAGGKWQRFRARVANRRGGGVEGSSGRAP